MYITPRDLLILQLEFIPLNPLRLYCPSLTHSTPRPTSTITFFSASLYGFLFIFVLFFRFHLSVKPEGICFSLTYFSDHTTLQVHPCCHTWRDFILFCDWIWFSCIYMFFIHPSIDRHIDCFHLLAIVNNTARNIAVHMSFQISSFVSLAKYPKMELWIHLLVLRPHLWHMEGPRLGAESEPQLPAYTTATAMPDPSRVCDVHHSSWECWIFNPLSKARDQTHVLLDTSWVYYRWTTMRHWCGIFRVLYISCRCLSCHLQFMTVLLLPFQLWYLLFLVWLLQLGLPILYWIRVVRVGILVLLLNLMRSETVQFNQKRAVKWKVEAFSLNSGIRQGSPLFVAMDLS